MAKYAPRHGPPGNDSHLKCQSCSLCIVQRRSGVAHALCKRLRMFLQPLRHDRLFIYLRTDMQIDMQIDSAKSTSDPPCTVVCTEARLGCLVLRRQWQSMNCFCRFCVGKMGSVLCGQWMLVMAIDLFQSACCVVNVVRLNLVFSVNVDIVLQKMGHTIVLTAYYNSVLLEKEVKEI